MHGPEIPGGEGHKGEFESRVALGTALLAVALAFASVGGNDAAKKMMLAQQQASNQWAYYQAKVIREHLYRVQAEQVELALAERGSGMPPEVRRQAEERLKRYREEAERYGKEKKEIEPEARRLEKARDVAMAQDENFDLAEVVFQIAIVLGSVSILSHSRKVFWGALAFGAAAAALTLNGFFLVVKLH